MFSTLSGSEEVILVKSVASGKGFIDKPPDSLPYQGRPVFLFNV
jgi:hypothetical protein